MEILQFLDVSNELLVDNLKDMLHCSLITRNRAGTLLIHILSSAPKHT